MKISKLELEELLEKLEEFKGRQTELISVYIPAGYDVNSVQRQLEAEKGTAKNIKSTATRKNVSEALDKMVRYLKTLKKTPVNGLAIFCGNISNIEGQTDLQLWDIEPPMPLKSRLYRCDKDFVLEPLKEMLKVKEVFGLLVMDRKEATMGLLEGKRIEILHKMTSGIPSKVRAGGQCLGPETLIMQDNGEILEIKNSHNPLMIVSQNFNREKTEDTPLIVKWENEKELFKITTKYPQFEIKASKDHTFFVRTGNGIEEKSLCDINEGDYLIMPERIDLDLQDQLIDFRFREAKNYWQLRVYSRIISQLYKQLFSDKNKTLKEKIPSLILKSSNKVLASFIAGFFDAEGYVSSNRVALGINNKLLTRQLQFALLRLGIISSINEYDNRKNPYSDKIRYTLAIDDLESLRKFESLIGFCSVDKQEKVKELIGNRGIRNKVRQLVVNGSEVARILRNSGSNTRDFHCGYFFCNKRQMSKEVFKKKILDKIGNNDLRRKLELFHNSNLIAVKISKIESVGCSKTIDIETKNHNFLANGLIVHNSSQRFHRITEGLTKEFYNRIAERMKKIFFDMKRLKGILVGGPIPTKDEFLDGNYLVTKLREKVIGVKDIGDTDESGLKELVQKSHDILANQEIIHEKKLMERFFETLGEKPDLATLKEEDTKKALEYGAVDILFLSSKLDKSKIKKFRAMALNTGSTYF